MSHRIRNTVVAIIAIVVVSCPSIASAKVITESMAKLVATEFNAAIDQSTNRLFDPSTSRPTIVRQAHQPTTNNRPYYIFSRGKNRGFIIVGGDDRLPVILGYTDKGDFIEEQMPPQLIAYLKWFETANHLTSSETANQQPTAIRFATGDKEDIEPLIQTHWHQSAPYNNKCPLITSNGSRSLVGCVATAASQVLYYFHKDAATTLQSSTPTYSYGDAPVTYSIPKGTPLKWDLMLNSYGTEPEEYRDAVATMCFATGAATWLTYGSSTGGHVYNLPSTFAEYYNLSSTYLSKGSMTQANWENTLYNQLQEGRPMVFAGFTTDGSSGHAIIVDGYKKLGNLFHFNFGWGGQADGYYTTVDGQGPGDFSTGQEILYKIAAKRQNLKVAMTPPEQTYSSRTNHFNVTIANNGTLDYSGIYFFANTSGKEPTSLSGAACKDEQTVFTNDGKEITITMDYKPYLARHYYFFVTDRNLNIIAQAEADAQKPTADLELQQATVKGSSEKKDGYTLVYNDKTTANFILSNRNDVPFEGTFNLEILNEKNEIIGQKESTATEADGNIEVNFDLTSKPSCPLNINEKYQARLQMKTISGDTILLSEDITNTVAFMLMGQDLTASPTAERTLKFSGHWDEAAFSNIIQQYADSMACYDMKDVEGITTLPISGRNPNAIYLVDSEYISGSNTVFADSACNTLSLIPGYDFHPGNNLKAHSIEIDIRQQPNKWYLFTSPIDCELPYGMSARRIKSHNTSGITSKTENVTALEKGKTYMLITSSSTNQTLKASTESDYSSNWISVVANPAENNDTAVKGLFVNTLIPSTAMVPDMNGEQYFSPVGDGYTAMALRGYFHDEKVTKAFRANSDILKDPAYASLGAAIEEGRAMITSQNETSLTDSLIQAEKIFTQRELNSTQTKAFTADLLNEIEKYRSQHIGTKDADYTYLITNPSFEDGKTTGWDIDNDKAASVKQATNNYYRGVGADGDYLLYNCLTADSTGCMVSQTLTGLSEGYYRVSAMLGTDESNSVTLFANDNETIVQAHSFGRYYLTQATTDSIYISEGESLTIGVKAGRWYKADDFHLYYSKADKKVLKGDANGDGTIDVADITTIASVILSLEVDYNPDNTDANSDGSIDVADITTVAAIILGNNN